jgi:Uri superfamily endonuclease
MLYSTDETTIPIFFAFRADPHPPLLQICQGRTSVGLGLVGPAPFRLLTKSESVASVSWASRFRHRTLMPITYQLVIEVAKPVHVEVGALGVFAFAEGRYVYTGSARRNPEARIARHLARSKTLRWHIDYLLNAPGVRVVDVRRFDAPECIVNRNTAGKVPVPRFGASDCRAGCGSHLKRL